MKFLKRVSLMLTAFYFVALDGQAYDSICYNFTDPTAAVINLQYIPGSRDCNGPRAAVGRFRDPENHWDEHRQLFAESVRQAGISSDLLETQVISYFTIGGIDTYEGVDYDKTMPWSPKDYGVPSGQYVSSTVRAVQRAFAVDEMAQLPDFGYSVWDWVTGLTDCPLGLPPTIGATETKDHCHKFRTHMQTVNASHWPPQSERWFDHYHQLAISRAKSCRWQRGRFWDYATDLGQNASEVDLRFTSTWKACEIETLLYEAVAQHFLQDSWSAGHMFDRWGSSELSDFPAPLLKNEQEWNQYPPLARKLLVAEAVGTLVGTIHGMDVALVETAGVLGFLRDPVSYPDPLVYAVHPDFQYPFNVAGDLHVHDLITGADVPTHADIPGSGPLDSHISLGNQAQKIVSCGRDSLAEVYKELGDLELNRFVPTFGAANAYASQPFDVTSCRTPILTNDGFFRGLNAFDTTPYLPTSILDFGGDIQGRLALYFAREGAQSPDLDYPDTLEDRLGEEYHKLFWKAFKEARRDPYGTSFARNLPPMVGVGGNHLYEASAGANNHTYKDPEHIAPGVPLYSTEAKYHEGQLALAFNKSWGAERCAHPDAKEWIDGIGDLIRKTRKKVVKGEESNPLKRKAWVDACTDALAPYIWNMQAVLNPYGNGSDRLDDSKAPMCSYLIGYPSQRFQVIAGTGDRSISAPVVGGAFSWYSRQAFYPERGPNDVPIAADYPTAYVGGTGSETAEQLAKLVCGAELNWQNILGQNSSGGFRVSGTVKGLPNDAIVGFFLSTDSNITSDKMTWNPRWLTPVTTSVGQFEDPGQPILSVRSDAHPGGRAFHHLVRRGYPTNEFAVVDQPGLYYPTPTGTHSEYWNYVNDPSYPVDNFWDQQTTTYDATGMGIWSVSAIWQAASSFAHPDGTPLESDGRALVSVQGASGGGGRTSPGGGVSYYFNSPAKTLPYADTYIIKPQSPVNDRYQCTFSPPYRVVTFQNHQGNKFIGESWDEDFLATCLPTFPLTVNVVNNSSTPDNFVVSTPPDVYVGSETYASDTFLMRGIVNLWSYPSTQTYGSHVRTEWSGDCQGTQWNCALYVDGPKTVTLTISDP